MPPPADPAPDAPDPGASAPSGGLPVPVPDRATLAQAVDAGIARYCAERRRRIPAFVAETYGWRGALGLHRNALGWDLARGPANLLLSAPYLASRVGAAGARRLGFGETARWLAGRKLFLTTDVAREVEWRVFRDFLELPFVQDGPEGERRSGRDALGEAILATPEVEAALARLLAPVGRRADDPEFRAWLTEAMQQYTGSRTAAVDVTNALISAGVGALAFEKWTPGAISLAPMLAQALAQKIAVASFPLGAGLGGLWYGLFPPAAPIAATAFAAGGIVALGAVVAAFAGLVADPVQRHLGLHQRRLGKLVDKLERELRHGEGESYEVRDHYVARIFDLLDVAATAYRVALRPGG